MRIDRLDLTRFGGFTDRSIDLAGDGVHVIVGANEAGKTTAMAAIRQLLYGIPPQSPHDYVHSYQELRIGAALRVDGGERHEVVRLKRNVNPLRDADNLPIDETTFARWCHDIDHAIFASVFAIGHDEIASGGAALLESDGDLGRAVFSVSRGTTDLNDVLRTLDQRAETLFKRAGQNPRLNAAIRDYKERRARAIELSVNAREVTDLDADLRDAEGAQADLSGQRDALLARREVLERIKAVLPHLAERSECLARRDALAAEGRLVDPAVETVLIEARDARRSAHQREGIAREAVAGVEHTLKDQRVDAELLAQREVIAGLQSAAGAYRQNLDDLPRRRGALQAAHARLTGLLAELPPGCSRDASGLPAISAGQAARIAELAAEFPRRDEQLTHAERQVGATMQRLERLRGERAEHPAPSDPRALEDALDRARGHGDLEAARAEAVAELAASEPRAQAAITRLGLGAADPRGLDAIPVPGLEVIRQHRALLDEASRDVAAIGQRISALEDERARQGRELEALLRGPRPPNDAELAAARAYRDEGWEWIVRVWRDAGSEAAAGTWAGGTPLADAYIAAVHGADALADRLRHDAAAVARRTALEAQIATADQRLNDERTRRERAVARLEHYGAEWRAVWAPAGVVPDAPAAMEAWHEQFRTAVEASVTARERALGITGLDRAIATDLEELGRLAARLDGPMPAAATLAGAIEHADRLVRDLTIRRNQSDDRAAAIDAEDASLGAERLALGECQSAMETWRAAWAQSVAGIGLDPTASLAEAHAVLDAIAAIAMQRGMRDDELGRIAGIEERNATFVASVAAVVAALPGHADLADRAPEVAVAMLVDRREQAQSVAVTHRTLGEERARHLDELDAALRTGRAADARIAALIADACLDDEAGFVAAIARSQGHTAAVERIAAIERRLRESYGKTTDALAAEAATLGDHEIAPQLTVLDVELADLSARWQDESARVGALTTRRRQITASGDAAEAMEHAQLALTDVAELADEYVQIVLARRLLEEQIAAYRAAHQLPLMLRANATFAALTVGRYTGLDTDTGNRGEPVLRARAANGRVLDVGALSTGTRDQLYLALRFAALEGLIERRGAMPLLLDDLFVHFDDERTDAGLRVLEQVSEQTQILLFTHHRSVGEQALAAIAADRVHVLHLAPMTA